MNQTFDYGEQGDITYKPNWGQPTSASGHPTSYNAQGSGNNPPPSVEEAARRQRDAQMQSLNSSFQSSKSEIEKNIQFDMAALNNQYGIQRNYLKGLYDRAKDDNERSQVFKRMEQVKATFIGRAQGIQDKPKQEVFELESAFKQELDKLQQKYAQEDMRVSMIRELVNDGTIDPAVGKQKALQAIGINMPLSEFKTGANAEKQKTIIEDDIRDIRGILERRFKRPVSGRFVIDRGLRYIDPVTGEPRELDPKKETDAALIQQHKNLLKALKDKETEFSELLVQSSPKLRELKRRSDIRKKALDAVAGGPEKGGGLGQSIIAKMDKEKPHKDFGKMSLDELREFIAGVE